MTSTYQLFYLGEEVLPQNSVDDFELDCGQFDQDCNGQIDVAGTNLPMPFIIFIAFGSVLAVGALIKWWENRNKE